MGLLLALVVALASSTLKWYFIPQLPTTEHLKDTHLQIPLKVYSKDQHLIAEFGEQRRIPVTIHQVQQVKKDYLINAIRAAEDDRFFEHTGVDPKSIMRAVVSLLKTGEKRQGGSTITMQVARNFFLTSEQSFTRKFNEILLALKIETENSKQEILELYLNKIFFGHRAYGVAAAAYVYYSKTISELTLAEIATLAGLPKFPSSANPLTNPDRAIDRRNYILGRMLELKYITENEYLEAVNTPNTASQHATEIEAEAPYIAEMVRAKMVETYGEEAAYTKGYKVYTTIDWPLQKLAQESLRSALYIYDERHGYRGPVARVKLPKKPSSLESLNDLLQNYPPRAGLQPSLVLELKGKSVEAYNLREGKFIIEWKDLSWAYRYRNTNRVGAVPASAADIVKRGDIIMVRPILEESRESVPKPLLKTKNATATALPPPTTKRRWRLAEVPKVEGAIVALNPNEGAIVALAGGYDFEQSKFNRVIQADRQPGSNFKPFIYSAALAQGLTDKSIINDAPIVFKVGNKIWRPENYSHKFYGSISLRQALTFSRNVASVRLLVKVGVKKAIDHVVKFGFKREKIPQNFTIALGTADVTPLELATGYAVFANGGYKLEPYFIERIEDNNGNTVFTANPLQICHSCPPEILTSVGDSEAVVQDSKILGPECAPVPRYAPRVISPQNAFMMTSILQDVVRIGTGQKARELGRSDIAGKTGTTNDQHDAWFSGFTSDLVATAWVGFDHPRSLGSRETGGYAALPMWIEFMRGALRNQPQKVFTLKQGVMAGRATTPRMALRSNKEDYAFDSFTEENVPKYRRKLSNRSFLESRSRSRNYGSSSTSKISSSRSSSSRSSSRRSSSVRSAPPKKSSAIPDQLF
jgi:penicillin-binding protein 1A